jgi:hypothetical protein
MFAERTEAVTITTDESGDGTGYISVPHGRVMSLHYAKTDYADTVDFNITLEATGQGLWTEENVTASKVVYPRVAVHDQTGVGVTFDGTNEIYEPVFAARDRVKVVVANGGDTKSGAFFAVIG